MTKYEFLRILEDGLKDFPPQELQDIIYDYKEHFYNAEIEGKKETDIINELGDPYVIVNQYRNGYIEPQAHTKSSNNSYNSSSNNPTNNSTTNADNNATKILKLIIFILAIIVASPIIFGFGGGLLGIIIAIITIPFSISISGIALLISKLGFNVIGISLPAVFSDFPTSVIVLLTIGSIAGTILFIILSVYLIKLLILAIRKLINFITDKGVN